MSWVILGLMISACAVQPAPVPTVKLLTSTATRPLVSQTLSPTSTPTPTVAPTLTPPSIDFAAGAGKAFANAVLKTFQPSAYSGKLDALPVHLDQIGNPAVIQGLTAQQKDFLSQNGFVVINAGDQQFKDLRQTVSSQNGQPYYLTTDAAYHALHTTFNDLLAALESEYMRPELSRLLRAEYDKVGDYAAIFGGQPLEKDQAVVPGCEY